MGRPSGAAATRGAASAVPAAGRGRPTRSPAPGPVRRPASSAHGLDRPDRRLATPGAPLLSGTDCPHRAAGPGAQRGTPRSGIRSRLQERAPLGAAASHGPARAQRGDRAAGGARLRPRALRRSAARDGTADPRSRGHRAGRLLRGLPRPARRDLALRRREARALSRRAPGRGAQGTASESVPIGWFW